MAGGLIQLVTYGTQDIFLTGTPQITFFKVVYRRHTNFSIESIEQSFDGIIDFDRTVTCTIAKNGDLINKTYLQVVLPEAHLEKAILNPNYGSPTSNDVTKTFRPDDIDFSIGTRDKNDSQAVFFTFKVLVEHLADIYRYAVQQVDLGVDLSVDKELNGTFPQNSFQADLLNMFDPIVLDPTIKNILVNYYKNNLVLTDEQIILLTEGSSNILSYDLMVNVIVPALYTFLIPREFCFPEIFFSSIELRQIVLTFFCNTDLHVLDDEELDEIFLNTLDQWYLDSKQMYVQSEKVYIDSCETLGKIGTPFVKFAWIERIGHYICSEMEILIGGRRVDRHYANWLNIWYELSRNLYHDENYDKMIGNVEYMTTFDSNMKPEYILRIPLQFWFCRHNGMAIPLVALRYHDVQINVTFNKLENCAYVDEGYTLFNSLHIKHASLFVDYIYLDSIERHRFARASHEYLIEQVQREEFTDIIGQNYSAELNFVHPCKELIWTIQANRYKFNPTDSNIGLKQHNYSISETCKGNPILFAQLEFNTYVRVARSNGNYFNYVQPYQSHSHTPADGINMYSFAHKPEMQQPSGTANLSRLNFIILNLIIDPLAFSNPNDTTIGKSILDELDGIILTVYATNYNVFRIMSGMGGLAFES